MCFNMLRRRRIDLTFGLIIVACAANACGDNANENNSGQDDAGIGGAGGAAGASPTDIPAVHEVRLNIVNHGSERVLLVQAGALCDPWGVDRWVEESWDTQAMSHLLEADDQCCTEVNCDFDGTGPSLLRVLDPGEVETVSWDGRAQVTDGETFTCSDGRKQHHWVRQPLESGRYRVRVQWFSVAPDNCELDPDATSYSCSYDFAGASDPFSICDADHSTMTEFDLPSEGVVEVEVSLP